MEKHTRHKKSLNDRIDLVVHGAPYIVLLGLFFFALWKFLSVQIHPVIESTRSEMKRIPIEVRRNQINQSKEASPSASITVPILMYHYVEYVQDKRDTIRQSLDINPNVFEEQIKTLLSAGYTFMTAKEMADVLDNKMALPAKPVLLTFDDGHWDLETVVLPILQKYHVKATAYIISGLIGGADFMSSAQLREVINSGLVEIGAHTVHHVSLKGKADSLVRSEVNVSRQTLELEYNIPVVSFAYPNGEFDQQAIDEVKNAGFRTAVSTIPGERQSLSNRYYLFRLRPSYRTGKALLDFLNVGYKQFGEYGNFLHN